MNDTVWKFNEAVYFLNQMKNDAEDQAIFTFNLSGFLSAARSITLIMQKELDSDPKFPMWYKEKQEYMKKDTDFAFFNGLRVDTVHKKIVKPVYTVRTGPFTISGNSVVEIPIGIVGENGKILPSDDFLKIDGVPHPEIDKPPVTMGFSFSDRSSEGAIEVCETFLEKIRAMLTEWQQLKAK